MDETPNKKRNDKVVNEYLEKLNKCNKFEEI